MNKFKSKKKCLSNYSNAACLFNGLANELSRVGILTFGPALALSFFLTQMVPVLRQRKTLWSWPWGKQQTWYVWQMPTPLYLTCSPGNGWWALGYIDWETQSSPELSFIYLAFFLLLYLFLLFITGLSKCTDAPYFTGSNYPSTPPLPAPHTAQIQKNSFHYCCMTKGHICQCGVVSVFTDAPLRSNPPPWQYCVSPFQPAQPLLFSFPEALQPLALSFSVLSPPTPLFKPRWFPSQLSLTVYLHALLSHSPPPLLEPSPRRKGVCFEGELMSAVYPHHFVFRREKRRWRWNRRPRKKNLAF